MENLYVQIKEIKEKVSLVSFRTKTPYPGEDVYTAPGAGLKCYQNHICLEWEKDMDEEIVVDYLAEQVAILGINNTGLEREVFKDVLVSRILKWEGNNRVRVYVGRFDHVIEMALDKYYLTPELVTPEWHFKKMWYAEHIESLKGMEKSEAKAKARAERNAAEYRCEISESSTNYRGRNYDVYPALKHLNDDLTMSRSTIIRHGEGLYVSPAENTAGIMTRIIKDNPYATQWEISMITGKSVSTVERYWGQAHNTK